MTAAVATSDPLAPEKLGARARKLLERDRWSREQLVTYQRERLPPEIVTLVTALGPLAFKVSRLGGRVDTVTPSFRALPRIARAKGLALREAPHLARAEASRPGPARSGSSCP